MVDDEDDVQYGTSVDYAFRDDRLDIGDFETLEDNEVPDLEQKSEGPRRSKRR